MVGTRVVMTVDAGTHLLKVGAFNPITGARAGNFVQRPLMVTECGKAGRVKSQNGSMLIGTMISAVSEKVSELGEQGISNGDIAAIGTSGHMHADFLMKNTRHGLAPLSPASMWNCQRNAASFNQIMDSPELRSLFIRETANEPMMRGIFLKALYRAIETPANWDKTALSLTTNNLLTYALTENPVLESSDGISAISPRTLQYAQKLFDHFSLENKFPAQIVKPTDIVGYVTGYIAGRTGLRSGTPVAAGGGDQMTALLGNGITKAPGILGLNYGASGVVTSYGEDISADPKGRIHYFGNWLMACCMATGLSVDKWIEETGKPVEELMTLASEVSPGANGARFFPWANGINHPVKAANTTAKFTNDFGRSAAEKTRAVIEGICLEMVLCANMMGQFGAKFSVARLAGGGSKDETGVIPQTFADMLGFAVILNREPEASSLGAAIAAAVAGGIFKDTAEASAAMVHDGRVYKPRGEYADLYSDMGQQYYAQVAEDYPEAWARHNR